PGCAQGHARTLPQASLAGRSAHGAPATRRQQITREKYLTRRTTPENVMNAATHPTHRFIEANGMRLCVEERGRPEGEPMLLVMGLAAQMTLWPEALLRHWV